MPGDSSACVGRLGDKSERDKLPFFKKKKKKHVGARFAAVLEELVVFFLTLITLSGM